MTEDKNRAEGAQQVATTMEAAQGVLAQNSIGAGQSAQLNLNKVTVQQRRTNPCNGTDHSSTRIHNTLTLSSTNMNNESICASGAQQVTTTMEAAQGVQAHNNIRAEQSAQLNFSNAALPNWTDVRGGTNRSTDLITSCSINMNEETKHISGAEKMLMRFQESLRAMRLDREKQSAQLNPDKVTVSQKQTNLCDGTDYRPIEVTNPITNNSNTMSEETICAQGAQQVATTSEASQSVQAQNDTEVGTKNGTVQPKRAKKAKVKKSLTAYEFIDKLEQSNLPNRSSLTGKERMLPVGITHWIDPSGEYIASSISLSIFRQHKIAYPKKDGSISYRYKWIRTQQTHRDGWFDLLDPASEDFPFLYWWGDIVVGYFRHDSFVTCGKHRCDVPVRYVTEDRNTVNQLVYETLTEFFQNGRIRNPDLAQRIHF